MTVDQLHMRLKALEACIARLEAGATAPTARSDEPTPIAMILHCPSCGERHTDVGEFATKPHHTHACQGCGACWRPAIVPTIGVQFLPGFKAPAPAAPATLSTASAADDAVRAVASLRHFYRSAPLHTQWYLDPIIKALEPFHTAGGVDPRDAKIIELRQLLSRAHWHIRPNTPQELVNKIATAAAALPKELWPPPEPNRG